MDDVLLAIGLGGVVVLTLLEPRVRTKIQLDRTDFAGARPEQLQLTRNAFAEAGLKAPRARALMPREELAALQGGFSLRRGLPESFYTSRRELAPRKHAPEDNLITV